MFERSLSSSPWLFYVFVWLSLIFSSSSTIGSSGYKCTRSCEVTPSVGAGAEAFLFPRCLYMPDHCHMVFGAEEEGACAIPEWQEIKDDLSCLSAFSARMLCGSDSQPCAFLIASQSSSSWSMLASLSLGNGNIWQEDFKNRSFVYLSTYVY